MNVSIVWVGTKAYDKLNWMLTKTTLLNDLKNYPQKTKQAVWKGSMPHDPHFVGMPILELNKHNKKGSVGRTHTLLCD